MAALISQLNQTLLICSATHARCYFLNSTCTSSFSLFSPYMVVTRHQNPVITPGQYRTRFWFWQWVHPAALQSGWFWFWTFGSDSCGDTSLWLQTSLQPLTRFCKKKVKKVLVLLELMQYCAKRPFLFSFKVVLNSRSVGFLSWFWSVGFLDDFQLFF